MNQSAKDILIIITITAGCVLGGVVLFMNQPHPRPEGDHGHDDRRIDRDRDRDHRDEHDRRRRHERWREEIPESIPEKGDVRTTVTAEEAVVLLPKMEVDLTKKCLRILEDGERSVNKWFTIRYKAGDITLKGNSITFGTSPEMVLHVLKNGKGNVLDHLDSIEWLNGVLRIHLRRFGVIDFDVEEKL